MSMIRKDLTFASGDDTCAAWFYPAAADNGARPVIVMAHGLTGTRRDRLGPFAARFAAAGIAALIDYRGFGSPLDVLRLPAPLLRRTTSRGPRMIGLVETNAAGIAAEFVASRLRAGSPAMSMVMRDHRRRRGRRRGRHAGRPPGLARAPRSGARRDPGRRPRYVADQRPGRHRPGWTGETALIRLKGEVVRHAESVVLPLLLPDSPVAIWWPSDPPEDPAADPLGRLAQRRITDAAAASRGKGKAIHLQCSSYAAGNSDLAWTRITPWRALLAAALDQQPLKVTGGSVTAERISPSAELLVAWLSDRLKVTVDRKRPVVPASPRCVSTPRRGRS